MLKKLDGLMSEFKTALSGVTTKPGLFDLKAEYVGKKGKVSSILKSLKDATPDERKTIGAKSNTMKDDILKQYHRKWFKCCGLSSCYPCSKGD